MSKPVNKPAVFVRKAKLKTNDVSILALESKGKITGFKARYLEEEQTFEVKGHDITAAFKQAEQYLTNKLNEANKAITNEKSKSGRSGNEIPGKTTKRKSPR